MGLTPEEIQTIATEAAKCPVPLNLLRKIGRNWLAPDEVEDLMKLSQTDMQSVAYASTRALLSRLEETGRGLECALRLFDELHYEPAFRKAVGPVLKAADDRRPQHEALFGSRDFFVSSSDWERIGQESGPRICCLIGDYGGGRKSGTGFLVGPNRILTAMHVFDDAFARLGSEAEVGARFRAVFDYETGELPATMDALDRHPHLTVVRFAPNWLVGKSTSYALDGTLDDPTPDEIETLNQSLDFALVLLAEPVGRQPVPFRGTQARGWFQISDVDETNYARDTRVIISQHPGGLSRRIDMGKVKRILPCKSRVLYDVNASRGTSGAPCLNTGSYVIGMHNARFAPNGVGEANQAIRIDRIEPKITPLLGNAALPGRLRPWKVDDPDGAIVPILGRDRLIDWLIYALAQPPEALDRRDRVYAAFHEDRGRNTGISFSAEIAASALAGSETDRVRLLGGASNLLPADPRDVAMLIGAELGIPDAALADPPTRPGNDIPAGADDGDKLDRWASAKLPQWFCRLAEAHRGDKWQRCWVILDDLVERPMSAAVRNFLAGMIEADLGPADVAAPARRFHWLFLGSVPSFLVAADVTAEEIDDAISARAIRETLKAAFAETGIEIDEDSLNDNADTLFATATAFAQNGGVDVLPVAQQLVAAMISGMTGRGGGANGAVNGAVNGGGGGT